MIKMHYNSEVMSESLPYYVHDIFDKLKYALYLLLIPYCRKYKIEILIFNI